MFQKIDENVYFCGLNDRERKIFDELIPLHEGTTYNSFLINGSDKVALIDTMYPLKKEEFIKNLDENNVSKIDYIIANHGEQDHSGALPDLIKKYPDAMIVTNNFCKNNIKEMLLIPEEKFITVKNNDEISLGNMTLRFILAPGVHWPDTMFTYLVEKELLFTCDFLGAHKTFDNVFAVEGEDLEKAAKRYYAEIMMPFRNLCKKYVKTVRDLSVKMILPSHGPVHKNPDYILNLYEEWTDDKTKNLVLLPYVSMYGSVLEMVDYLAKKFEDAGIMVKNFDIVEGDLGEYAMDLVDANTIILGASTVLAGPHPAAMSGAYLTGVLAPKAKNLSIVGSYGWNGKLVELLAQNFSMLKAEILEPVVVKGKAKEDDYKKLDILATSVIERHKGNL